MFVRELFQKCLCGLMLGWAMTAPMPVVAGEGAAVNLRDSPAKATTARNIKVVEEFRANGACETSHARRPTERASAHGGKHRTAMASKDRLQPASCVSTG
jgi:hypothetical protein